MKIDSASILEEYTANQQKYNALAERVSFLLYKSIEGNRLKIHSLTHRIKEIGSIIDKMRRKNIANPFLEMHDIVGFRVVCLFLADLEPVRDIIRTDFDVFDEDNKIDDQELDTFGYMSLHIKAKLKPSAEEAQNCQIMEIPFEIQVRTIAQDAWASISHHIDYKTKSTMSRRLKRDFNALSGLFYVADTHFALIKQHILEQPIEMKGKYDRPNSQPAISMDDE
jgi:ppGpp synthetase/RelA/SpoT-type nucleotidyltranferase